MAEKRMFSKTIVDSDAFLDMPLSAQALYFHLSMRADDDGFLNNAKKIMRTINANQNDYDLLIAKAFIIQFDDGICVIKHWRINNYLRNDRYKPTIYQEQKNMLEIKDNGRYSLIDRDGIPDGYQCVTQNSIDKNSIDKLSVTTTNIYSYIEKELCRTLSQVEIEMIDNWLSLFEEDIIKYAVQIAILSNKKNFKYINGIIKNWKSANYSTLEEIKDNEYQKKESKPVDEETLKLLDVDWLLEE